MQKKEQFRKFANLIFLLAVILVTGFRWYKTVYGGVAYDEAMTYHRYTADVNTGLTSYDPDNASSTNNHVLNSILIHYSRCWFPGLECQVRIPSFIAGMLFTFALAYLVCITFRLKVLGCASFLLICFIPYVFDYSYLARGYAFALCGIFVYLALAAFLVDRPVSFKVYWIFMILLSLCNIIALGAMLSALVAVLTVNIVFILIYCPRVVNTRLKAIPVILINSLVMAFLSGIGLFALYYNIYPKLAGSRALAEIAKKWHGWDSFVKYFYELMVEKSFAYETSIGKIVFAVLTISVVVSVASLFIKLNKRIFSKDCFQLIFSARGYLVVNLAAVAVCLFVYSIIFGKSLGLPRNQVFFIPLALIVLFLMIDIAVNYLNNIRVRQVLVAFLSLVMLVSIFNNLPSMYLFEFNVSGPLLRKLKQLDPDKVWTIAFSEKMRMAHMGFSYYCQFGYKFLLLPGGNYVPEPGPFDVYVCESQELSEKTAGLNFIDENIYTPCNFAVGLNCPPEKVRSMLINKLASFYQQRSGR